MPSPSYFSGIVTKDRTTVDIAQLPKGFAVEDVKIYVIQAFDVGISIEVGYEADHDAYSVAVAVNATGRKTPTLGAGVGHDQTARNARAYITGGVPTQGKAIAMFVGYLLPPTI